MTTIPQPPAAATLPGAVFAPHAGVDAPSLQLRDARADDLAALLAIEAQFPGDRIGSALFGRLIRDPRADVRVAELGGRVVGYHVVRRPWLRRAAWLYSIAVDAAFRRRGIGRRLLADAGSAARRAGRRGLWLEVRQDNAAAVALYERAGFRRVKSLRRYYDDSSDGWRYRRDGH